MLTTELSVGTAVGAPVEGKTGGVVKTGGGEMIGGPPVDMLANVDCAVTPGVVNGMDGETLSIGVEAAIDGDSNCVEDSMTTVLDPGSNTLVAE